MLKISNKFKKMCEVYKIFADKDLDFSLSAMEEMYNFETFGKGNISIEGFNASNNKPNGYAVGKKFLNITVSMWMEEIEKYGWYPVIKRIYSDDTFPIWWLDKTFNSFFSDRIRLYGELKLSNPIQLIEEIRKLRKD